MEELLFQLYNRVTFVHIAVPVLALITGKRFGSFLLTSFIIAAFDGYMNHLSPELLVLARGGAVPPELPHYPIYWYGTWVIIDMMAVISIRYGHKLIQEKLGFLAKAYMLGLLCMIALQIVGYVDSVFFHKTDMITLIYSVGINAINIAIALLMIWQYIILTAKETFRWQASS